MSEKNPSSSAEHIATPEVSAEQYERVAEQFENKAEKSNIESAEKKTEDAKVEALKHAISVERGSAERTASKAPASTRRRGISKKEREASFQQRMKHVQGEMSAPERAFSKLIHLRPIEKTSEIIGSTIARPNAILAGAVVAFVAVLAVYLVAKNVGYPLSGSETILAFIVGWVAGLLYDFLRVMITGKK